MCLFAKESDPSVNVSLIVLNYFIYIYVNSNSQNCASENDIKKKREDYIKVGENETALLFH